MARRPAQLAFDPQHPLSPRQSLVLEARRPLFRCSVGALGRRQPTDAFPAPFPSLLACPTGCFLTSRPVPCRSPCLSPLYRSNDIERSLAALLSLGDLSPTQVRFSFRCQAGLAPLRLLFSVGLRLTFPPTGLPPFSERTRWPPLRSPRPPRSSLVRLALLYAVCLDRARADCPLFLPQPTSSWVRLGLHRYLLWAVD